MIKTKNEMINELIKQFSQTLIINAIPGVDKARILSDLNNTLSEIDTYIATHGAAELASLENPMHGALAFDMLRRLSANQFIPIYAYILYTQALKDGSVGSSDNIDEAWLKKAYMIINSEWTAIRALIVLGSMGTSIIHQYSPDDLVNLIIIGCLLNMSNGSLQQKDNKLYHSLQQMRPQYRNLTDSQIKSILKSIDEKILESKSLILK